MLVPFLKPRMGSHALAGSGSAGFVERCPTEGFLRVIHRRLARTALPRSAAPCTGIASRRRRYHARPARGDEEAVGLNYLDRRRDHPIRSQPRFQKIGEAPTTSDSLRCLEACASRLTTVISVMSRDRVGIVADVSTRIAGLGGDIADLSQTTLRGFFTLILLATFPGDVSLEALRRELDGIRDEPGADRSLEVIVRAVQESPPPEPVAPSDEEYVLAVRGPDRVGLLADVTRVCKEHRLNITDLSTRSGGGQYVTLLHVDASRAQPLDRLRAALDAAAATCGFAFTLQHSDVFRATNEIGA
jgi:glycine cleavage system transcriptional repressor